MVHLKGEHYMRRTYTHRIEETLLDDVRTAASLRQEHIVDLMERALEAELARLIETSPDSYGEAMRAAGVLRREVRDS